MDKPKGTRGRPLGRDYPVIKQVRLANADAEALAALADAWRCSEAAAIRRAIQEALKREEAALD